MTPLWWVIGFVIVQRLAELALAAHNTRALRRQGAVEHGNGHYPLFILLHASWLLAIALLVPSDTKPDGVLLAFYGLLQLARIWIIASLGRYWTTRIVTVPDAPLVRRGPYRWLRHPNYWLVAAEIALLPLVFGEWRIALGFSLANAALLYWRIKIEEAVLAPRRHLAR